MNCNLIPQPRSIRLTGGALYDSGCALTPELRAFVPKSVELISGSGNLPVSLVLDSSYGEEQYKLVVEPSGAAVIASTSKGAYYALCTLSQLFALNGGQAPCCVVEDQPTMPVRGFSDDISRGQISTMENFKDIIRRMSLIKCNLYMPYIEDVLALKRLPQSGKFSDPMSADEWKELVSYAKDYYVDIVPIVNTLGHWDKNAGLEFFQDYVLHEGDSPEGAPLYALDVRKQKVRDMVDAIIDESLEIFGHPGVLHVGGDEADPYKRLFPLEEAIRLYNGHFRRLRDYLSLKGVELMMYSDMYTKVWGDYQLGIDAIDEMPEDIRFVYWDYACRESYPNIEDLRKRNKRFYLSPAAHNWKRFLPHHYLSWLNSKNMARDGADCAQGIIMSSWCDDGLNLREEFWMGLYGGAMFSWNCRATMEFDDIVRSFFQLFYGLSIDLEEYHSLMDYDTCFAEPEYIPEHYDGKPIEFWYDDRLTAGIRLFQEFFQDATQPVDPDLKAKLAGAGDRFEQGLRYFGNLKPKRNATAYEVFLFDIKRSLAAYHKVMLTLDRPYHSREEAMADIPAIQALTKEVTSLMEENERLWFLSNRQSEWESAKCKYLELIDSLRSLERYCRYGKKLMLQKKMLLGV